MDERNGLSSDNSTNDAVTKPDTKVVILGGFLGSGKTTLMMELGKRLMEQGKKVALITNDQGEFLVDTQFAKNEGFTTAEVLNGCFCCRFPDFMNGISSTIKETNPGDLLLGGKKYDTFISDSVFLLSLSFGSI